MNETTNYKLAKPEGSDYVSIEDINNNMDIIDKELKVHADHDNNAENPHKVTAAQVGLGNVDNVSTNNQAPTYSDVTTLATLTSGEKLSAAFPKIKLAITNLINHLSNKSNPHGVTASQVGLGNVSNVTTNNQTPTYTAASSLTALVSGETLTVAFGKISKAVSNLIAHLANKSNPHSVTAEQVGAYGSDTIDDAASLANANNLTNGAWKLPKTASNLPSESATIILHKDWDADFAFQIACDGSGNIYFRVKIDGGWGDWTTQFLPLVGGTLSGNVIVQKSSYPYVYLKNTTTGSVTMLGNYGNRTTLETRNVDGESANRRLIYVNNSVQESAVSGALKLIDVAEGVSKSYNLFGEHSKPSGSYTGNGSSEERVISIGSISSKARLLYIHCPNYGNNILVGSRGACTWGNGGDYAILTQDNVKFTDDGELIITTTNSHVNASGRTYYWQVL